jgi:hypothetical protein
MKLALSVRHISWLAGTVLVAVLGGIQESRADGLELTFIYEPGECSEDFSRDIQRYFDCKRVGFKEPKELAKWRISLQPDFNVVIGYGAAVARQEPADLLFYPGATQQTILADSSASCRRLDRFDKGSNSVVFALFQRENYAGLTDADKACLDEVRESFGIPKHQRYCGRVDVIAPAATQP